MLNNSDVCSAPIEPIKETFDDLICRHLDNLNMLNSLLNEIAFKLYGANAHEDKVPDQSVNCIRDAVLCSIRKTGESLQLADNILSGL